MSAVQVDLKQSSQYMKPYPHQLKYSKEAYTILATDMIVYLAMEERTGKTLIALLTCEQTSVANILVVTKKQALAGWLGTLNRFKYTKNYTVTNYHQLKKFNVDDYDLVILDEAHNYISSFPKVSGLWHQVARVVKDKPIIYLSATPYAQGTHLLYHQFALSSWSPFKRWKTSYAWFRAFGIPDTVYLAGRQVESYKKARTEEVMAYCQHLFITATRKELGFEHEPVDRVHYITLTEQTKLVYNSILKHKVLELNDNLLTCDTSSKMRTVLHQLEGGTVKVTDKVTLQLGNIEKINAIKALNLDVSDMVIMYQYKAEKEKLQRHFPTAEILQATSFAEGVDLSHKTHLVVYSQDFSTARHSQRRARQANLKRKEAITIHHLVVKKGISEEVYKTVSLNKTNYIDSLFKGVYL